MFQPAVPVKRVLDKVHDRSYVLPAIQREFVWSTDQICMLFDSLLRGYPIGSFLFWDVQPGLASSFRFYDFLADYHEKLHPYATAVQVPTGHGVIAILDGQQRLTSLNIGLYGSHAERQPRKWASNPDAYPKKRLYLDLTCEAPEPDTELGLEYGFRFLAEAEAKPKTEGEPDRWFKVGDVLKLNNSGPDIHKEIQRRGLLAHERAFDTLYDLYRAVVETNSVNAYVEEAQDPDKVLDIFVRVNSAGTQLSYSDLLLSMATNQWSVLDAREEVRSLVAELNGERFAFTKDLVLKAGLVLIDVPDVGFKVSNFTAANMATMETRWGELRSSLLVARSLLASFGYSAQTLSATSALIPVAYYIHQRGLDSSYVTGSAAASDRAKVQSWVNRSLMKRGVWGSGLDTLLNRLRDALRNQGALSFPAEGLETAMAALGKALRFEEAEIAELLDLRYGRPRTFTTLAALYPGLDMTKAFHVDHIFPRSRFTASKLTKAGVPAAQVDEFISRVDGLPNLQLLDGLPNVEKQDVLPSEWLKGPHFASDSARQHYGQENNLDILPDSLGGFLDFYDKRRDRMAVRLRELLTSPIGDTATG